MEPKLFAFPATRETDTFTFIQVNLKPCKGNLPMDKYKEALAELVAQAPKVDTSKGVIISFRGPTHVFSVLGHLYHPTKFTANYEPRLNGGLVNAVHGVEGLEVGDLLSVPPEFIEE